jgi:hypothetical protein
MIVPSPSLRAPFSGPRGAAERRTRRDCGPIQASFGDADQQDAWFKFVHSLKQMYPTIR